MDKHEIKEELKMPYEELLLYLIKKYGGAKCLQIQNAEAKVKRYLVQKRAYIVIIWMKIKGEI